jgi:hypothetical protein
MHFSAFPPQKLHYNALFERSRVAQAFLTVIPTFSLLGK